MCGRQSCVMCWPLFFPGTPPTEIYTLSLHDALPIFLSSERYSDRNATFFKAASVGSSGAVDWSLSNVLMRGRSEEHTSELQSRLHLVCRLLLEKKKDTPGILSDSPASVADRSPPPAG